MLSIALRRARGRDGPRASSFAPQLAELLTTGCRRSDDRGRSRRSSPPTCCGSSSRRCCSTPSARSTTAVLHARGRFALAAVAPIGNTIVLVIAMLVFRRDGGTRPGPRPRRRASSCASRWAAPSGSPPSSACPPSGCRRSGLPLPPRRRGARGATRTSGRCSASRAGRRSSTPAPASCSAAALIVGGGVAGGVVAYQLAMVVFLAPYGIVAQPIHTAVLPRLAAEAPRATTGGPARARCAGRSTPWSSARCRSPRCSPPCRPRS